MRPQSGGGRTPTKETLSSNTSSGSRTARGSRAAGLRHRAHVVKPVGRRRRNKDAAELRDALTTKMTAARAQKLAHEWKPGKKMTSTVSAVWLVTCSFRRLRSSLVSGCDVHRRSRPQRSVQAGTVIERSRQGRSALGRRLHFARPRAPPKTQKVALLRG